MREWSTIKKLIFLHLTALKDKLPDGYTRIAGITMNNGPYYAITDFKLKGSDIVRISFSVTTACNVFGCYQGTDATDNYDLYASTSEGAKYFRYGSGTYASAFTGEDIGKRFDVVFTPTGSTGMPEDSTWTEKTFTSANDMLIGATTTTGSSSRLKGTIYGDVVVDGRIRLIPCKRTLDSAIGYYSPETETFYENQGSGTPTEYTA